MRGLLTEAAVLAYGPPVPALPRRKDPMARYRAGDRADGIWWQCGWCLSDNRVIAEGAIGPGESITDSCDACGRLTQITRRIAIFA
jgi:hypothetical protein